MADSVVGLEIRADSAGAIKSVGSIKTELKAAQQEAISLAREFGDFSTQAVEASKRVANLRDEIGDANARIKLFDPGAKFQAFTGVLNTAAGGFSALTGAAALFGSESEDLQKTLVKVQSALALTQGLNAIADAGDAFKNFGLIAKQALNGIKTGIAATGIGALVVALGLIVAYWEDIAELVSGVSDEQEDLNKLTDENVKAQQEKLDTIDSQDNVLKLQGKSEKEILAIKIKQTDEVIAATKQQIENAKTTKALQVAAAERNAKILKGFLDFIAIPIRAVTQLGIDAINGIAGLLNKIPGVNIPIQINGNPIDSATGFLTSLIFDPKEVADKADAYSAELQKNVSKLENDRAGLILSGQDKGGSGKDKQTKELEQFNAFYKGKTDTISEFADYEKEFAKQAADGAKAAQEQEERDAAWGIANFERIKKEDAEKLAAENALTAQKVANAQIVSSALGSLADVVGRQTAAGKALAIAQASIDGFLAVQKALASAPPPFNFIAAAAVGVATLANIKKIVGTKIPGQGGGGGAVPSGLVPATPNIPRPQQQTTALDRNSLNQIGNASARAFVVESDVSGSQERIRRLNRAARLG
jgi:hypothetical protein